MFRPVGEMMIIEKYKDPLDNITLPDNWESKKGEMFIVKAMGEGMLLENGSIYKPNFKVGDKIAIIGKILTIPDRNRTFMIARMNDVCAVEVVEKDVPIPDKI